MKAETNYMSQSGNRSVLKKEDTDIESNESMSQMVIAIFIQRPRLLDKLTSYKLLIISLFTQVIHIVVTIYS